MFSMNNLTLVAFYGKKPKPLISLINSCLYSLHKSPIARYFIPYTLYQIHATIIGLEFFYYSGRFVNNNYYNQHQKKTSIKSDNFPKLIDETFPVTIRIGGFNETYYGFTSFEKTPYERTFHINRTTSKVILIGWPFQQENPQVKILSELRSNFENECNIAHKYHNDKDLFFVLGKLSFPPEIEESTFDRWIKQTEEEIRDQLSNKSFDIILKKENLSFVSYISTDLNELTSTTFQLKSYYKNVRRLIEILNTKT